jgi:D-amino-acid dehydrogenase
MKVVVIGAGIIGLTSAYHLLQSGADVTVIDADRPGAGASHGNAGWIVPADSGPVPAPGMVAQGLKWMLHRDSPLYIKPTLRPSAVGFLLAMARHCNRPTFRAGLRANIELAEHTMDLLDGYARDGVAFEMHAQGLLMAFADAGLLAHHRADLDLPGELGLQPQLLSGAELSAHEPALSPALAGGIFFPQERHVRPDTLVSGLVARCRALGAQFVDSAALTDVHTDGRSVVRIDTTNESFGADVFLLAAGANCGRLGAKFGAALPVRPGKGYSVDYLPPPVQLKGIVNLCDAKVAVTPLDGALRLAGTMEFAGWDTAVNPRRVAAIRRAPGRYFAEWHDPEPAGPAWAGARPMTPDGLAIIGRIPNTSNAYVATGHGMLGLTLGPATGALVAETIASGLAPAVLAPFAPDRFAR